MPARHKTACPAISGASVCAEDAGRKPPEIPQRALAGGRIPFLPYSAASIPAGREKALPDVKRAVHSERRAAAPVGRCGFAEPHRAKNGRPYANKPRGAFFRRKRGTSLRYAPCRRRRSALRGIAQCRYGSQKARIAPPCPQFTLFLLSKQVLCSFLLFILPHTENTAFRPCSGSRSVRPDMRAGTDGRGSVRSQECQIK